MLDGVAELWQLRPMPNELTALPESFPAGTTIIYRKTLSDYPAGDGWTLKLHLAGASVKTFEAEADGNDFVVTLAASATSSPFLAGLYQWTERVSLSGAVYEIDSGIVTVLPDLSTAAAGDYQVWLERTIVVLTAHIEGRMTAGNESYMIAGRSVVKIPIKEAVDLLSTFESRLARLKNPSRVTRSVLARFTPTGFDR